MSPSEELKIERQLAQATGEDVMILYRAVGDAVEILISAMEQVRRREDDSPS